MADRVATELDRLMVTCREEGARKEEWLARVERVRARIAGLVGAAPDEIAFTKNTSDGLNTIAQSLGLKAGVNVVIVPELEHANNVYAWAHLRERGVDVRCAKAAGGSFDVETIAALCDERTRLVSISAVSFLSGARADLTALARLCRPRGIFLLTDAVQALGVVDMQVERLGIDGLAAATQKGLLGMYGLGVLYCRREWLPRLRPPFLARSGVDDGALHESSAGNLNGYRIREDARRFEVGNHNFAGVFTLDAALSLLLEAGVPRIEQHVLALGEKAIEGLDARGYRVITPRAPARRAGIVAFEHSSAATLVACLARRGVRVAARRGYVRVSFHLYNAEVDVAALLEAVDACA